MYELGLENDTLVHLFLRHQDALQCHHQANILSNLSDGQCRSKHYGVDLNQKSSQNETQQATGLVFVLKNEVNPKRMIVRSFQNMSARSLSPVPRMSYKGESYLG